MTGFVSGRVPVAAFIAWFAGALWEIERWADEDDYELALTIENRLAEYTGGHISETMLRATLAADLAEVGGVTARS